MDASGYSLLIVDDEAANRDMFARRLEKVGYQVAVAADGRTALDMLEVERFDLVLLDLVMPGISGYQVLESLAQSERTRDIPVIVVTALGDKAALTRCIAMGACDYITKPVELAVVKSRIWQVLEARRYLGCDGTRGDLDPVSGNVLIVEDNEFNLDILRRRIQKWGCHADCAGDGVEAIRRLAAGDRAYDLIMLDISMPRKDGFDVLEFIRSRDELSAVPVIMVSAIGDSETVLRALKMGARDFVMKPFNAVELNIRVRSCLRMKRLYERSERMPLFGAVVDIAARKKA